MLVTSIISICKTLNKVDLLDRYVHINIYLIFKYWFECFNMDKKHSFVSFLFFSVLYSSLCVFMFQH